MLSVCRLFGNFKIAFWGTPLFLWLCFFCFGPSFGPALGPAIALAVELKKQNTSAGQALNYIAGELLAIQQGNQSLHGQPLAGQSASEQAAPGQSEPGQATPDQVKPDQVKPEQAKPDQEMAGEANSQVLPQEAGASEHSEQAQPTQAVEQIEFPEPQWEVLEEGLENTLVSVLPMQNATQPVSVNVLRIEPEKWDFELLTASEYGRSKSLGQWAKEHDLVVAINASMYLPDGKTSTGYMRQGEHINNGRIVTNFGAFFVAMPENSHLPQAAVLDRNDDSWQDELDQYHIVVQNYRLMTSQGKPLWGPAPLNSLAAIGQDKFGRILFLHCGQPISAIAFVEGLTRMPLDLVRLMYVEGGHQAAMLVNTKLKNQVWTGKYAALLDSNAMPPLPNVIGVKHKSEKVKTETSTNATIE